MVGLHAVLRFQNVGVDGALGEEINLVAHLAGLLLEHADELAADDLALGLGLVHVGQKVQEAVGGIHVHQVRVHLVLEHVDDLLGLALAHKPVVHVHAHEVLPDGLDEQRRHHRGIHAARQRQQHLLVAHLLANGGNLFVDKRLCQLGGGDALHVVGANVLVH